jgi:hypothetical protein
MNNIVDSPSKTTSYKVVLPYYLYASISFLIATLLLFLYSDAFIGHYFQPKVLAITHTMALGWATMLILGASHQLVPVFIEGKLYSDKLAHACFLLTAIGIPLLVYGFQTFDMGAPAKWGGRFIVLGVLAYVINLAASISKSGRRNVHAVFVLSAAGWLLYTVLLGLVLVYNFQYFLMPKDSVHYLPLHAHTGIVGWFLLLVIGVASRLIPMFLISKYTNPRLLWAIYSLINGALVFYMLIFHFIHVDGLALVPVLMVLVAVALFVFFCRQAFKQRLRKKIDEQMQVSLLSVAMILLPILLLFTIVATLLLNAENQSRLVLAYGFLIFFGWLTSIILGMTFKTLPFITWNKVYHHRASMGKTPNPKDLFNHTVFRIMSIAYLAGCLLFACGILFSWMLLLKIAALSLIITSVSYNFNVLKLLTHQP